MRTAVISDIHGNLEAFQTVLADMDERKVDRIICLGDVLGYGPNPVECVDLIAPILELIIVHSFLAHESPYYECHSPYLTLQPKIR